MVEHDLAKVGVASSSLVSRSKHRSTDVHWALRIIEIDASASFFVSAGNHWEPAEPGTFKSLFWDRLEFVLLLEPFRSPGEHQVLTLLQWLTMPLSEFTIRHARITGKNYSLGDFDGLSLMVTAAGGKRWLFRFYWTGQQKRMSLGSYPAVGLRDARAQRICR